MKDTITVSARQLTTFIAAAVISAGARTLPGNAAAAGRSGTLAALAALPVGLIIVLMMGALYKRYPNKGLADIFTLSLGPFAGGAALIAAGAAAPFVITVFTARTHSELFTSTIFPETTYHSFLVIAVAVMLFITRRGLDTAARMATVFAAALFILLITVFFVSLGSIKHLMPVYPEDLSAFARAVPYSLFVPSFIIIGNLLSGNVHNRRSLCREGIWSSIALSISLTLITGVCIGVLGASLTARSTSPIFAAAKALSIPGILERVDAFTVIVWILADITQLILAGFVFLTVLGKLTGAKQNRFFAAPFAFLTLGSALALSDSSFAVTAAEAPLLGGGSAAFVLGIFAVVFLAGMLRKV